MSWLETAAAAAAGALGAALLLALLLRLAGRPLARTVLARFMRRLFRDPYHENLWEIFTGTYRFGVQHLVETDLRASTGEPLQRPFGRRLPFPGFGQLLFDVAQLDRLPTPLSSPVDMGVVIGPRAKRPLRLDIPVMVSGMGYGIALSREIKTALARGAARAGTSTNTGEGPFLPEERQEARHLVVQYSRNDHNKTAAQLLQADMIEIQLGQGAETGVGVRLPGTKLPPLARRLYRLGSPDEAVTIHSRMPGFPGAAGLKEQVRGLRALTGGVPIGVKLAAGDRVESDMAIAVAAGVDFITLDGAEAGTHGAAPLLEDDFGIPTFVALCRGVRFLRRLSAEHRPSLIVSGGLFTPGDFLKALALGADAVAIGTAALFAAGHDQVWRALPWEPPLEIVWRNTRFARRLDIEKAATALERYLRSVTLEMAQGVRALGKTSLRQVDRGDLVALAPRAARLAGVRPVWRGRDATALGVPAPGAPAQGELDRPLGLLVDAFRQERAELERILRALVRV